MASRRDVSQPDYQAMAQFRYQIRRFLRFSEQVARSAGLKPQQYQLMLALKGLPQGTQGSIGELAERLQIQHHSTVELVDRLAAQGLIRRRRAGTDRRQVLLDLTPRGEKVLRDLAIHHRDELRTLGPTLVSSLRQVLATTTRAGGRHRSKY
ncbi:MAG TPA: MarR family winged helix-turn-helix transcriptional regulator [Terriglobales bacterium]|nr:MarR family winged helix-turn-helix transcriptional regulator [Terriglobales bacterium]